MDRAWNASGLNAAINTAVAHRAVNVSGFAGALLNASPAAWADADLFLRLAPPGGNAQMLVLILLGRRDYWFNSLVFTVRLPCLIADASSKAVLSPLAL